MLRFSCGQKFSPPLGKCQAQHLLGVCLNLQETAAMPSILAVPFCTPASDEWGPDAPHPRWPLPRLAHGFWPFWRVCGHGSWLNLPS